MFAKGRLNYLLGDILKLTTSLCLNPGWIIMQITTGTGANMRFINCFIDNRPTPHWRNNFSLGMCTIRTMCIMGIYG